MQWHKLFAFCLINKGGAIQGSAKSRDAAHFSSIITEGEYYEVKNFYTFENRYMNAVVGHEAVIDLKSDTKVTRLNSPPLSIPRYYFNFTDFAHILNKEKGSRLLTGIPHSFPYVSNCIMHSFFIPLT
jgi:replication factor A1